MAFVHVGQVLIMYPLACEDPHPSLRRVYYVGQSFSSPASGGMEVRGEGGGPTSRADSLFMQSQHHLPWREARERARVAVSIRVPDTVSPTRCCRHALIKFLGKYTHPSFPCLPNHALVTRAHHLLPRGAGG